MKTLLALEELIRSYNGITALDNFKALEALKVLKELDLKYKGFGEDTEISSKRISEDYFEDEICSTVMSNRLYIDFCPTGYEIIEQGKNCLVELKNDKMHYFISDKLIWMLYECVCDILEFGELSENTEWEAHDSIMKIQVQDMSNESNCVMCIKYDSNICEMLSDLNSLGIDKSTELVFNFSMKEFSKILKRIILAYRSQEIIKMPMPLDKIKKYSKNLAEVLSSDRYFRVLNTEVK